jgi:hypothetical protein
MRFALRKLTAILLISVFVPLQLSAWGPKGHQVVADIAYSRLTPQTKKNLKLLLGNETLAQISTWADEVRKEHDESYGWHFVDIPKDATGFDDGRDCFRPQDKHKDSDKDHRNCAVDRIQFFQKVLADGNAPREQRVEALKWLVHFVGDLHQPLHAIEEARGGNDIKLPAFGSGKCGDYDCNLHWAWDTLILEHSGRSEQDYVKHEQKLIRAEKLEAGNGGPVEWANESHAQARKIMNEKPAVVDEEYYRANIHLVDQKLALAGLRLATLLNSTLGNVKSEDLKAQLRATQ